MGRTKKPRQPRQATDPMLVGFSFPYAEKGATPYDYLNDPETGLRSKFMVKPSGAVAIDLSFLQDPMNGSTNIPSVATWDAGQWFDEADAETKAECQSALPGHITDIRLRAYYLTSGEGTPGNYKWRLYRLPHKQTEVLAPPHPKFWPKVGTGASSTTTTKTTTKASSFLMPRGLRIRCPGCGHWYDEDDLKDHVNTCCPSADENTDWAIACECCTSLDDTSKVKPGFPRKPKVQAEKKPDAEPAPAPVAS